MQGTYFVAQVARATPILLEFNNVIWSKFHLTKMPFTLGNTNIFVKIMTLHYMSSIEIVIFTWHYALFFSFYPTMQHCSSVTHTVHTDTCGNIDLTQSSAITVKRCWHIHHPVSKRLIQSPRRDWLADSICSYHWHHWIKHCCYFSTHLEYRYIPI